MAWAGLPDSQVVALRVVTISFYVEGERAMQIGFRVYCEARFFLRPGPDYVRVGLFVVSWRVKA